MFRKEHEILEGYIRDKKLKQSGKRIQILDVILQNKKHLSAEEWYQQVVKKYPGIGQATIYRTIKVLCDSGLIREFTLDDGIARYESASGSTHHHHLVCVECRKFVEIADDRIEEMKLQIAKKNGFKLVSHRFELYGICQTCLKK